MKHSKVQDIKHLSRCISPSPAFYFNLHTKHFCLLVITSQLYPLLILGLKFSRQCFISTGFGVLHQFFSTGWVPSEQCRWCKQRTALFSMQWTIFPFQHR